MWKTTLEPMQYLMNRAHQHLKMTAAKVMDVVARLPDCAGQAADEISAYTQVNTNISSKTQSQIVQMHAYVFQKKVAEVMGIS